jgi:hypothetical protein
MTQLVAQLMATDPFRWRALVLDTRRLRLPLRLTTGRLPDGAVTYEDDIQISTSSRPVFYMRVLPNRGPRFLTTSNVPTCRTAFMIDWPSNFIGAPHDPVEDDTEAWSHIDATRHPNGPAVPA